MDGGGKGEELEVYQKVKPFSCELKGNRYELHMESTHTDIMHNEGTISEDSKTITCWGTGIDLATGKEAKVRTVTTLLDKDAFTLELKYADFEGKETKTVTLTHKRKQAQ